MSNEWSGRPLAALAMGRTAMKAGAKRGDLSLFKRGKALVKEANAALDRNAATKARASHPLAVASDLNASPILSSPAGSASPAQGPAGNQKPSP